MKQNLSKHLLIIDCYTKPKQIEFLRNNMLLASSLYKNVINQYFNCKFTILNPCYDNFCISSLNLNNINGAIFTGSSYSVYDNHQHVENCKQVFHKLINSNITMFGSCFGLQLFVQETGGIVEKSLKGREIGIGRNIEIVDSTHYLYKNKNKKNIFNSISSHGDHITSLNNGVILSYNNHSIQSCELNYKNTNMIGVQYHPEYTLEYLGKYLKIRKKTLFEQNIFNNNELFDIFVNYLIEGNFTNKQYNNMFNLPTELINDKYNHREIINWINNL